MQHISQTISKWCYANLPVYRFALDFYATALNTFEGGPPGTHGEADSHKVTETLLERGETWIKEKRGWDFWDMHYAVARGFAIMARFWWFETINQHAQARRHLKEKRVLIRLLLDHDVFIPLSEICEGYLSSRLPEVCSITTLQALMAYIEQHRQLPSATEGEMKISSEIPAEEASSLRENSVALRALFHHARYESAFTELGLSSWFAQYIEESSVGTKSTALS